MAYKTRKQISIGLIYLLIFALLGAGVYFFFFKTKPTCFDGLQNQGEGGIDCGSPCAASCEHLTIKDLKTEWVKIVKYKEGFFDLAARIENPNPNFGLAQFKYTFKIFDGAGNILKEKSGSSFVLPGQSKYLIENNLALEKNPAKAELLIEKIDFSSWQKTEIQAPNLFVKSKEFKSLENRSGVSQASGVLKNSSVFDLDAVWISILLFDPQKNIIGLSQTQARTVLAGEERYFSVSWLAPLSGAVNSLEMIPETNILSPDNFLSKTGEKEKFQEY